MDKYRSRELKRQLGAILLSDWDPIGVRNIPDARDEYDRYVGELLSMLKSGATAGELTTYLRTVESDRMGLPRRKDRDLTYVVAKVLDAFHAASEEDAA